MFSISKATRTVVAALIIATPFAASTAASAQADAQPAPSATAPSFAHQSGDETITGHILNFDGHYNLTVRDQRGYVDNVDLHQGTIINPTGLTLQPGMSVTVMGVNHGSYLAANEIDTPYHFTPGLYDYGYGGYPYYGDFGFGFGGGFGHFGRGFGYGRFGGW